MQGIRNVSYLVSRAASSAQATASPTASARADSVRYIPPYKTSGSWSVFDRPNRVKMFQETFELNKSSEPVFLRGGAQDVLLYRGIMGFSVLGIGIALFSIYRMATGRITKKGES